MQYNVEAEEKGKQQIMPTDEDFAACFSNLDIFIKRYLRGKLHAILNVNRKTFSEVNVLGL